MGVFEAASTRIKILTPKASAARQGYPCEAGGSVRSQMGLPSSRIYGKGRALWPLLLVSWCLLITPSKLEVCAEAYALPCRKRWCQVQRTSFPPRHQPCDAICAVAELWFGMGCGVGVEVKVVEELESEEDALELAAGKVRDDTDVLFVLLRLQLQRKLCFVLPVFSL